MDMPFPFPSPQSPCRVGLIGVTGYGGTHLKQLLLATEKGWAKPAAAVVINPAEAKEACQQLQALGAEIHSDYTGMLRDFHGKLDLCLIPTGINWHAPMTIAALEAGTPVLVEKPLCGTDEEARTMIDAERKTGRFIAVGFQDLYDPGVLHIKKILLSGELGRIKRIRGWALWPRGTSYYSRNSWAGRLSAGGATVFDSPFNNAMSHFLNLLLFFGGSAQEKMADITELKAELFRTRPIESFDTGSLLATTAGGVELLFHGSHSCRRNIHPRIWIEGEKGTILWNQHGPTLLKTSTGDSELFQEKTTAEKLERMFASVLARASGQEQWICTAGMAAVHTQLINRLHRDFQIQDLPPGFHRKDPEDSERIPVINDIEDHMARASLEGTMLGKQLAL